jgi:hypothetical protein
MTKILIILSIFSFTYYAPDILAKGKKGEHAQMPTKGENREEFKKIKQAHREQMKALRLSFRNGKISQEEFAAKKKEIRSQTKASLDELKKKIHAEKSELKK